jgi:HD superfamily phosphohydrolase
LVIDGAKGLPAIEAFILARLFMFQQIYLHKATRAAEWMIRAVLARAAKLLRAGKELPGVPRALHAAARGEALAVADYLELDDAVLVCAMHAWEDPAARRVDPALADVARRIRERRLFKTYELFGEQASPAARAQALALARDVASRAGVDPDLYVGLDVASDTPFAREDEPLVVFAKGRARPLSEVSFLLGRLFGHALSRTRLVFAPELREEVLRVLDVSVEPASHGDVEAPPRL